MPDFRIHGRYCGPQDSSENREPIDEVDASCKEHDDLYGVIGTKAYFYFNDADRLFLYRLNKIDPKKLSKKARLARRISIEFFKAKEKDMPYLQMDPLTWAALGLLPSYAASNYFRKRREYKKAPKKNKKKRKVTPGVYRRGVLERDFTSIPEAIAPPPPQGSRGPERGGMIPYEPQFTPRQRLRNTLFNHASHGKYIGTVKRRKRRKRRKLRVSKPVRKYIRSKLQNDNFYKNVSKDIQIDYYPKTCAINKVAWSHQYGDTTASLLSLCESAMRVAGKDNANAVTRVETLDMADATTYFGKRFKIKSSAGFRIANNSNHAGVLVIYTMRCMEDTSISAATDLTERLKSAYSDTSVTAKEDLPNQYWSTPGGASKKWKMVGKKVVHLTGGNNCKVFCKRPTVYFNPDLVTETGESESYVKGCVTFLMRMQGELVHDTQDASLVGIGQAQFDIESTLRTEVDVQSGIVVQKYRPPTISLDAVAIAEQADHDGVEHAAFAV